jgi:hypothetical protein
MAVRRCQNMDNFALGKACATESILEPSRRVPHGGDTVQKSDVPLRYPPHGSWPDEMRADMAAAFKDEATVATFMAKVRSGIYAQPIRRPGCRLKWSKTSLETRSPGLSEITLLGSLDDEF